MELSLPGALAGLAVSVPDPRDCPPVRWGVLGAGHIGERFVRDTRGGSACEVVAVGSRTRERAELWAGANGVPHAFGSYEELVGSDLVDAVYVATPHSEHRDNAILALEAGKPVLVEKSFTRNAAEARAVLEVAAARGLFAMEAMWSRHLPHMTVARAVAAGGLLGDIVEVVADHGQPLTHVRRLWDPLLAGGAMLDLGVYPVSFIHSILGRPDAVVATGDRLGSGVDATSATALVYDGALGLATTSMRAASPTRAWIAGTAGRIDFDTFFYRPGGLTITLADGERTRYDPDVRAGFAYQVAEAARCLDAGLHESPVMPWRDTIEVLEIMDEARRQLGALHPGEAAP